MKFNVILISMAIGLLSHSVISAPVDNNNDVADNDNGVEMAPYHIDVPGADINIDDNGVQVEKKPQDDDDKNAHDNNDVVTAADTTTGTENDDDTATTNSDSSTLDKRSPFLGNKGDNLDVTSDGIDAPGAGVHVGATDDDDTNDLAQDDTPSSMDDQSGMKKRDGVDVAPLGLHLGRGGGMARAGDGAQLKGLTQMLSKRNDDETNDDDGDDLKKQQKTTAAKRQQRQQTGGMSAEEMDDLMTKREHDMQGPPPPGMTPEELDDFNTKKRDLMANGGQQHQNAASFGGGVGYPGAYPNRYISEDLADAMT